MDELTQIPNFDVGLTGFDLPSATKIIDDVLMKHSQEYDDFDFTSILNSQYEPKTKPGELILLGEHRVFCGDSTNPEHISRLIGQAEVNLTFTDPPYGIDYRAIKDGANVAGDNVFDLRKTLYAIAGIDCSVKYICGHWRTFVEYVEILGMPDALIVWNKSYQSNRRMQGHNFHLYNPRHEFLFYYGKEKKIKKIAELHNKNVQDVVQSACELWLGLPDAVSRRLLDKTYTVNELVDALKLLDAVEQETIQMIINIPDEDKRRKKLFDLLTTLGRPFDLP